MSFVVFVGCQYWGLMLGDTRSLDLNKNIVSNDSKKIYRINNTVAIAFAGYTGVIEPMIEDIIHSKNKQNLSYMQCSNILKNCSMRIEKSYKEFSKNAKINTGIGLMGISNEHMNFLFIKFYNGEISLLERQFENDDDSMISVLGNGMYGNLDKLFLEEFNKNKIVSIKNIASIYEKILLSESINDISINDKFIKEIIFV